ncbi:hypothetical protein QCD60_22440 [Pokkaliibacter sp. MBI-7]|uniref:AtuA-related protein n=1 Tax=Pokkaliibacter sp. MBI-7 TaxID=3040600 RepID=UPI002449A66F|nr:hypothetical protein [Pokkaliibacter sp. MBI-7]MDH2435286.1 hypothetical protein [Pokkaliibacter sp. MBI-7]
MTSITITATESNAQVRLVDVAHARAGDKGNTLNIAVFVYRPEHYDWLVEHLTEDVVRARFAHRKPLKVSRYCLPNLQGMNLVLEGVLEGGVNASSTLDRHGKSLSYLLLGMYLPAPGEHPLSQER